MLKSKNCVILLYSVISIVVFSILTNLAVSICSYGYGIMVGLILMICAIPFHLYGKQYNILYTVSFALNTIANSFSVSAYYLAKKININMLDSILSSVPCSHITGINRHTAY